jgi:hypothetical protein
MTELAPRFRHDKLHLKVAARSAVRTWAGGEGIMSREVQERGVIDQAFLRRWLGLWMLARANPRPYRASLAEKLGTVLRPALLGATEERLPALVPEFTLWLQNEGATRGLQTSLVSKFAFSLRPEVIVPYDKRARHGLSEMFGRRLPDHDYLAYLVAFHRFAAAFSAYLDETGVTAEMRSEWEPLMSERLFRLRASDKYLMLLGGFPVERMC